LKQSNKFTKLDDWVKDLLVDPLDKQPLVLSVDGDYLESSYGRKYPVINGIYDLRLLNNDTTESQKIWKTGQIEYIKFFKSKTHEDGDYEIELNGVREVYNKFPIVGSCLDVGGHQGRLRAFIESKQKYMTCDPYLKVFDGIEGNINLLKTYPFLLEPVNFLACDAEFLPFKSKSFQNVHMRSVVDHFSNPELALNEAYRVLDNRGCLIIGLYVHGGKDGLLPIKYYIKESIKFILPYFGIHKYTDHHVWHPTFKELENLVLECGFQIDEVHWQSGYNNTVCYLKAIKINGLKRKID
jgi:SAM-dependent methyltransferase